MSLVGTRSKDNSNNLFFGLAELYIGDSATNLANITPVLASSDYFGCLTNISFTATRSFIEKYSSVSGVKILSDLIIKELAFKIDLEFVEITNWSSSIAFGGDGTETNILDGLFSTNTFRAELVFTYPNKTNTLTFVFPTVKINSKSASIVFAAEEPAQVPTSITPLPCTSGLWTLDNKIGNVIFA